MQGLGEPGAALEAGAWMGRGPGGCLGAWCMKEGSAWMGGLGSCFVHG